MIHHVGTRKEAQEVIHDEEKLSCDLKEGPSIQNSYYLIQHLVKCVVLATLTFILLEKISRKYDIFRVETNYENLKTENFSPEINYKQNLTLRCEQNLEKNDKFGGFELLKEDIVNMKQMIIKLGDQLRERRRFECITKKEFSRIEERVKKFLAESGTVDEKIRNALHKYEADKVALFDYAASYAGGSIVSILDTTPASTNKISKLLGFFRLVKVSSPDHILNPSSLPGECFTFLGERAKILIHLGRAINIGSVSMEHSFFVEDISSAPHEFKVYGLQDSNEASREPLETFNYEIKNKQCLQTFEIPSKVSSSKKYEFVLLEILNNHGNKEHTSIYRFRVHSS